MSVDEACTHRRDQRADAARRSPRAWLLVALAIALPLLAAQVGAAPRKAKPGAAASSSASTSGKSKPKPSKAKPKPKAATKAASSASSATTASTTSVVPKPPPPAPSGTATSGATPGADEDDDEDESAPAKSTSTDGAGSSAAGAADATSGSAASSSSSSTAPPGSPTLEGKELDGDAEVDDELRDSIGVELDLNARFLYRGLALTEGAVVQPSAWVKRWGFTAAVVANVLLGDEPPLRRVSHVTPALTWAHRFGRFVVEPGVLYYYASSTGEGPQTTVEAALDVAYLLDGGFRLALTNHVDVRTLAGAYYATLGPEYVYADDDAGWTIRTGLGLAFANAKLNEEYFGVARSAFDLLEARLAVQRALTEVFYFVLHTETTVLLPSSLRGQVPVSTLVNGGAALGCAL